jgi:hypothetical protein
VKKIKNVASLLIVSVSLILNPITANAESLLWESPLSGVSTAPLDIPKSATLRGLGTSIYQSNPDELIFKIVMAGTLEEKPFQSSSRDLTVWIYWPFTGCWSADKNNCAGLFTLSAPTYSSIYPTTKSTQHIFAMSHDKASNINVKATSCKIPWWISNSYYERDTVNFAVSITCLGIPKDFGFYGYSGITSNGSKINSFTDFQTTTNPFHNLAAGYANQVELDINQPLICVSGAVGTGTSKVTLEEQCTENSSWEFSYCNSSPLADLQVYRSKTWRKIQTVKGIKDDTTCEDLSRPYIFNFTNSSLTEKFRIKNYGNKKFKDSYMNLNIKQGNK